MVDQGAGRPTGPGLGHVDLLDALEPGAPVGGQEAAEARSEAGPDGHGYPRPARCTSQGQHRDRLCQSVSHQHRRPSGLDRCLHRLELGTPGGRDDHGIGLDGGWEGMVFEDDPFSERAANPCQTVSRRVAEHDRVHRVGCEQLACNAGTDRTGTQDGHPHQRSFGPERTLHPPDRRAVPAPPRRRSTPATAADTETAARARLITCMDVGLAGIEPATSPLSGVRSNRLSYSPADPGTVSGAPDC